MRHSAELFRCLETIDVAGARRVWAHAAPNMPQPKSDADALMMIHHARTQMAQMAFKLRAYSHAWLIDHGYPSGLPDEMKPKAERMYPRVMDSVGISVRASASSLQPVAHAVQGAMSDAVLDAYANGDKDPIIVKGRMMEARDKQKRFFADLIRGAVR